MEGRIAENGAGGGTAMILVVGFTRIAHKSGCYSVRKQERETIPNSDGVETPKMRRFTVQDGDELEFITARKIEACRACFREARVA